MTESGGLLDRIIAKLEGAGVPYMVTGSVASSYHGRPRTTHDIDIVIDPAPSALRAFVESLLADGYYVDLASAMEALARRRQFNVIEQRTGWKIDLIVIKDRPFSRTEFARRRPGSVMGVRAFVTSREDAILSKLEWAAKSESERQLEDVAGILSVGGELDREYLEEWVERLGLGDQWERARELAR